MSAKLHSLKKKTLLPLPGVSTAALALVAVQQTLSYPKALAARLEQQAEDIASTIQSIAESWGKDATRFSASAAFLPLKAIYEELR